MTECKACGHRDTQHAKFGCNQGFCKCELSNQDVIDFEKLAALREAGEKMAQIYTHLPKEIRNESNVYYQILLSGIEATKLRAALAEWKAANK